jgi:hypothetical protein
MVAGASPSMTVQVNFLSPGREPSELRVLLRQLALLWKFELRELAWEDNAWTTIDKSPLMVDLGKGSVDFQKAVARYMQAGSARTLLFATQTVALHPDLQNVSGVKAISWQRYHRDLKVQILQDDPLFEGFNGSVRLLRFNDGGAGAIQTGEATVLLRAENGMNLLARRDTCYTLALPVWQFGIVSFPAWFRMMENALFFNDGKPHLAPGPYVAFRIDDLPVTGQLFVQRGYNDDQACREIQEIQAAHRLFGAKMEYMISSHVITLAGDLKPAAEVAPKAFRLLRELYQRGEINIGAHGVAHLDVETYRRTHQIVPQEFFGLDKTATRKSLESLKQGLAEFFGKDRLGFVAPAWGYKEGVTKPEAARLFSYIADSNQHLQQSDGRNLFGTMWNDCVSLFETWRSGMCGIKMADKGLFRAYLKAGLPIHMMLHGLFTRDPLTWRKKTAICLCAALALAALNLELWMVYPQWLWTVFSALQITAVLTAFRYRRTLGWWLRLKWCCLGFGDSLRNLARAAIAAEAKFIFAEELANHMAGYSELSVIFLRVEGRHSTLVFKCAKRVPWPISVYFPFSTVQASIQPEIPLSIDDNVAHLGPLEKGTYEFKATMRGNV